MKSIKAVLTDLDGTILFPNDEFTEATKSVIQEMTQQGIAVVPVTGRSYRSSIDLCRLIGIQDLGVFNGGSIIVDIPTGKTLWERPIEEDTVKAVLQGISPFSEFLSFGHGRLPANKAAILQNDNSRCMSIWVEAKVENLNSVIHIVEQYDDLAVYASSIFNDGIAGIQINHIEANKQFGVQKLLELAKISKLEALAIGDDNNDIPFFLAVGTSVAMGDASEDLRAVATYETCSIGEDGFKEAMTQYVLS